MKHRDIYISTKNKEKKCRFLTVKLTFDLGRWWLAGGPVGSNRSATQPLAIHRGDRTLGLLRNKLRTEMSQRRYLLVNRYTARGAKSYDTDRSSRGIAQITSKGANYHAARCLTRHGSSCSVWRAIYLSICARGGSKVALGRSGLVLDFATDRKGKKRKWKLHTRGLRVDRFF